MSTWHDIATEVQRQMTTDTRDDGSTYVHFKDGAPEWMRDLAWAAHDDGAMLPDDYRYAFLEEVIDTLADADPDADPEEALYEIEPDVYTAGLTKWLNSRVDRVYYLTEVLEEFGSDGMDGFRLLALAQNMEQREVADKVMRFIYDRAEELDNEGADDYSCDQCCAAMINGVFCHETGCPNTGKVKTDGVWVRPDPDEDE